MTDVSAAKPVEAPKSDAIQPLKPEVVAAYKKMLTYQFSGAVLLVAALGTGLLLAYGIASIAPPILLLVTLSGMLGAFFSALSRLYNVDQLSVALISTTVAKLEGRHLMMYSFVPPLVGAIGAVVLYVAFVSGLVAGELFPKMDCKVGSDACNNLLLVLTEYGPVRPTDYGKALIWGFIAGFSERLVPDTLQALVAKSQEQKKT